MAGIFTEGISKVLSGVYTLIKSKVSSITQGERGKVAYPFTSDWGPVGELRTLSQADEFASLYNAKATTLTASKIYKHAYNGKPNKVLAYRMATATAAKGTCTLPDAAAAMSLTLETLYPSARSFTAVVKDGVTGGKIVQILESGVLITEVAGTTITDLVTALNQTSYVRVKASGSELPANTSGTAFSGGNNGNSVTTTEYAAFLEAIESDATANAFALDGVTDIAILETADTFTKRVRNEGFYVTFVKGGPATWDQEGGVALANTVSKATNYRAIINVGNGCDGYTAADMAIYIAARVASVALNRTITDEVTPYSTVNKKLKRTDRETLKLGGTLVFIVSGDSIIIDEGVNTLTKPGNDEQAAFGKIRVNNTLDQITKDLEAFGEAYKRDKSNTAEAREMYAAAVETEYLAPLAQQEVIQADFFYMPDPDYHGKTPIYTPKLDEAFFYSGITPVDSMERVYQKIVVNL